MNALLAALIAVAAGSLAACGPVSDPTRSLPFISRTTIRAANGEWKEVQLAAGPTPTSAAHDRMATMASSPLIALIGKSVWSSVMDNRFNSSLRGETAHALPAGVKDPDALSGWEEGNIQEIKTVFEDMIGSNVVEMLYKIDFQHSGRYRGKGHYLANVGFVVAELRVKSLYHFDTDVRITNPINVGAPADPIAKLKLLVRMRVRDRVLSGEKVATDEITLNGRGVFHIVQRSGEK